MGLKRRNPASTRLSTPTLAALAIASDRTSGPGMAPITPVVPLTPARQAAPSPGLAKGLPPAGGPQATPRISGEERHRRIAEAAYRYAERAGFVSDPVSNWLTAEREIDALLTREAS